MKSVLALVSILLFVSVALDSAADIMPTFMPAPPAAEVPPAVADAAARTAIKPIKAKKIILVGDSTTQVGSGWGGAFCATHVTSILSCINLARGGRSTFDYRAEGSWDIALHEMQTAGYTQIYVLIQFGHNDQPGKPGRSTDLYSEYPANLRLYVKEARATGAIPVLVTPLTRRIFKSKSLQDDLEPWAEAVRAVAKEMNVPLVDLHAVSVAVVQSMGARAAIDLAQTAPPSEVLAAAESGTTIAAAKKGNLSSISTATDVTEKPQAHPNVAFDYTHLGPKGAAFFSKLVTLELAKVVPDLRTELIE